MPGTKTVGPVICHPDTGDFEAMVAVDDGTDVKRVACRLRFPVDMSMGVVVPALERQAEMKLAMAANRQRPVQKAV